MGTTTQVLQFNDLSPQVKNHHRYSKVERFVDRIWREVKFLWRVWFDGYKVSLHPNGWSVQFREVQ